jgi:3-deoxy-D-manno-octulosonate 8-phosphate phosphatase KdsC-like HAD superfamily phosphatase
MSGLSFIPRLWDQLVNESAYQVNAQSGGQGANAQSPVTLLTHSERIKVLKKM